MKISLPSQATEFRPIFIIAPTARNGITLVQRLLNSTRKVIIYGENLHFMEHLIECVFSHLAVLQQNEAFKASRKRFLNETTEYWSSDLNPDLEAYLSVHLDCFYRFVALYEHSGQQDGFSRWGIKYPFKSILQLNRMRALLPNSRTLYLYRNLFDVARSMKARGWANTQDQLAALATQWQDNVCQMLETCPDDVALIRYETLLENSREVLSQIEQHVGVDGIDQSVLERKINTFATTGEGLSPSGYVEPIPLTSEECNVLRAGASRALEMTGYQDSKVS